jgi:hypothetical protein
MAPAFSRLKLFRRVSCTNLVPLEFAGERCPAPAVVPRTIRWESDQFGVCIPVPVQGGDGGLHGQAGQARCVLDDGGEIDVGQACQAVVVVPDDREVGRHVDAGADEGVQQADSAANANPQVTETVSPDTARPRN